MDDHYFQHNECNRCWQVKIWYGECQNPENNWKLIQLQTIFLQNTYEQNIALYLHVIYTLRPALAAGIEDTQNKSISAGMVAQGNLKYNLKENMMSLVQIKSHIS